MKYQVIKRSLIDPKRIVEIGDIFAGNKSGRVRKDSITIADLRGVAVEDLTIAQAVLKDMILSNLRDNKNSSFSK